MRKNTTTLVPDFISSLPQPTEPNQWVHTDLFGPLKTYENRKKFILCITNAFTKYVQLMVLPNKEAATMAAAIFNHWKCWIGVPVNVITDQGKEFCAGIS